ncbi:hypothetical protein MRB53_007668 [Persea americana]|uniref:Uncharacterized protein n=1 Tax=Persea americana TaxID=3435 RepID=A0ACC2MKM5_PERAE|nr:hypothetical protein MRB53_007668 [Persea americana]
MPPLNGDEGILADVVNKFSLSYMDVWTALEKHFSSQSRARLLQLRLQLQTVKKDTLSITNYLQKVKIFTGHLTAAGHSIPDDEILLYILGGLGHEYDALATSITTCTELIDLDELHGYDYAAQGDQTAQALVTTHGSSQIAPFDPAWYLDSGVTNHITADLGNLSLHSEYQGNDQV